MYKPHHQKLMALVLLLTISLSLAGCGGDSPPATAPAAASTATLASAAVAPTGTSIAKNDAGPTDVMVAAPTNTVAGAAAVPTDTVAAAVPGGTTADIGFRSQPNGFSFPNYGGKYPETPAGLTITDTRQMFGDKAVCATGSGATCVPGTAALQWLDQQNKGINGGSCEGFAVATLLMYEGKAKAADYGADSPFDLKLEGNDKLRSLISVGWAYQGVEPVASESAATRRKSPSEILDMLIASFKPGAADQYTLGFYFKGGGHAVTPYSIEDKGNGLYLIHVYDNNYPGVDKYVEVDRTANTWKYASAALNPTEDAAPWSGGVGSYPMDLTSLRVRQGPLVCPWCNATDGSAGQPRQMILNGPGHLMITDKAGNKLGIENGKLVNTIPGAHEVILHGGALVSDQEPYYNLPQGVDYTVVVDGPDGTDINAEELSIFGQGVVANIKNMKLTAGQRDNLTVSADGHKIAYAPGENQSPNITLAIDQEGHDYLIKINNLDAGRGEELDFSIDEATGKLAVKDSSGSPDKYDIELTEIDATGSHTIMHKDVKINGGDTEYLNFGAWDAGKPLMVEVDHGSDGTIDATEAETAQ